ncbi:MAG: DUF5671 domain-containing protein, partial [Hyphococcus sp.]
GLLGMVAGYVGALAFGWIEAAFQDELARRNWRSGTSSLRWAISGLVVGYPIFLYLGNRLAAARRKQPDRRGSRVRAWLTYVTLIFAALTLIGDLVAVVYQFLAGELGARFLSKAGVVGVISGVILWNYTRAAEREEDGADWAGRILAIATSVVVAALVVWAFTVVRSPQAARAAIADEQRLQDLRVLVRLIDCHRTYFGEIPDDLTTLETQLNARAAARPVASGCAEDMPADPGSGAPYIYLPQADDRYRICITFERGWPENAQRPREPRPTIPTGYGENRLERAFDRPQASGEACFPMTAVDFEANEEDGE